MLYKGGEKVTQGTYWDIRTGTRIDAAQDSVLPGTGDKNYIKASVTVMLLAAPVIGLLFAVFLPFIGIAMAIGLSVRRILGGAVDVAAKSVPFGWKPIEAYLSGRKQRKDIRNKNVSINDILDALNGKKKIEDRKSNDIHK